MTTPILGIPELADGQIDQFATANEAIRALEAAGNDFETVDLSAGNVTLTSAQFAADAVFRSSGNTVSRNLTIPAEKRLFIVHNNGSATLSVVRGSTTISVAAGAAALLYSDGTTNGLMSIAAGGGGGGGGFSTVEAVSSATTTATPSNSNRYMRFSHSTAVFHFEEDAGYTIGDEYHARYVGAGVLTLTSDAGFTLNLPYGGTDEVPPLGTVTIKIVDVNEADVIGVTVAA